MFKKSYNNVYNSVSERCIRLIFGENICCQLRINEKIWKKVGGVDFSMDMC